MEAGLRALGLAEVALSWRTDVHDLLHVAGVPALVHAAPGRDRREHRRGADGGGGRVPAHTLPTATDHRSLRRLFP